MIQLLTLNLGAFFCLWYAHGQMENSLARKKFKEKSRTWSSMGEERVTVTYKRYLSNICLSTNVLLTYVRIEFWKRNVNHSENWHLIIDTERTYSR